ncbi:MAG: FHA domain-containing protein, partial [bacterium]
MKYGSLQVSQRQGVLKEYGLDLPSAIVGRGEGAHIVIDDFSVSRRHARLTIDSGRLMVEDLGSSNGTFVDGERLEPGVRHLIAPDATLRFGELEARYVASAAIESATRTAVEEELVAADGPTGLSVSLVSPTAAVDPGKFVTAHLTVINRGRQLDTVSIDLPDLPSDWYTVDQPEFPLLPGARADVVISLHPPRQRDSLSGEYSFSVTARSREYQDAETVEGSVVVQPFEAVSLSMAVVRSKRKFQIIAENKGNEPVSYELEGRDDEQAFGYAFDATSIELQPGQKRTVGLSVSRKQQWFGPAIPMPFQVIGHSASGAEVTARGQLAVNPPLQRFRMPAMYTVAAVVLLMTALAVMVLTDGGGTKSASAEDPYAGVHLCTDANAKAKQEAKNAQAATDKPNSNAVVVGPTDAGRPLFGEVDKNGAPFFAQNDARWATQEYARSTQLPAGRDWCGTTIEQCGCAMTSVSVMLALYDLLQMPDGTPLSPKALNDWFNGSARQTDRGWVSRGYIYGDVIWTAANELSGEIKKQNPNARTVRFVRTGSGSEDEIKNELRAGRPVVLEVPGHWIAAVGLDGDQILINDPFYRDRKTLDVYAGKVRSSVLFEPSSDLSAIVVTAPADVKFRITDKEGRVVATGTGTEVSASDAINQIPGASVSAKKAWRDPTCIEKAPPEGAGTNQISLPGNPDDYKVEIIGTGDKAGTVDIHTYGKDGTSSISTIEGQEGTKADVSYDPNKDKPVINITANGTPQATTTPNPGGGSGGGQSDDATPSSVPTLPPAPTATQTPFVEQRTAMTLPAEPGQTRVEVATNSGFELGDPIRFAPGLPNEEDNIIVGFGSFLLANPLKFSHSPGEPIARLQRPPGQGPGLPPGVTPPPATGPIEPPKDITLNCSTLYQASPKQATFICDATVNGAFTTTRWSLNGKVINDFSGASSFIYAFPTDSPASISITVCNQTQCRSTTRTDKIAFPSGDATAAGNGANGSGGTNGLAPPPPPAGQVAVVCGAEFPITPDGQVAQFNCQVNFSGDFTNISWSAP